MLSGSLGEQPDRYPMLKKSLGRPLPRFHAELEMKMVNDTSDLSIAKLHQNASKAAM